MDLVLLPFCCIQLLYQVLLGAECPLTGFAVQGSYALSQNGNGHSGIPRHLHTDSCIHPSGGIVGDCGRTNLSDINKFGQFGAHIFIHIFALYVGVGVAKRIPTCSFFFVFGHLRQLQLRF